MTARRKKKIDDRDATIHEYRHTKLLCATIALSKFIYHIYLSTPVRPHKHSHRINVMLEDNKKKTGKFFAKAKQRQSVMKETMCWNKKCTRNNTQRAKLS